MEVSSKRIKFRMFFAQSRPATTQFTPQTFTAQRQHDLSTREKYEVGKFNKLCRSDTL